MAKSASALAFALLAATIGPASATGFPPECLRQIDDLIVEYDLPASAAFAGTQTGTSHGGLPDIPKQGGLPAADLPHTPAGRPGAALLEHEGAQPQPTLPPERQLLPAKRAEVQAALHDARAADAVNDNAKCFDAVRRAQALIGKKG
jgi:hypothetical protein